MSSDKIVVGREEEEIREILDSLIEEDYPGLVERATREKIALLRESHVNLYRFRLDSQLIGVNVDETERLLAVWTSAEGKEFSELSDEAKLEVLDALAAEQAERDELEEDS